MTDHNLGNVTRILGCSAQELLGFTAFEEVPGWDSLMRMQLIVSLENHLGRELSIEEILEMTPQSMMALLR